MRVLVAGGGGFIGGHLVNRLVDEGHEVVVVDCKTRNDWWQSGENAALCLVRDLRDINQCREVVCGSEQVYNLACDMGGMGFIENNKAACMLSVLINTHLLQASVDAGVDRYFYSSSACVYAADKQVDKWPVPLRESDAYPAMPEDGYGWEKLFSERMCRHFSEDYGITTRIARYHNVYGPFGTWTGGREKVPAALCRKVAEAVRTKQHELEIWGDGEQTRSFMWIDDCIKGTRMIMDSDIEEPINLGSAYGISINSLADYLEAIAGVTLQRRHIDGPLGVRGRNSDNTMIKARLGWEPDFPLHRGMQLLYEWVDDQVARADLPNRFHQWPKV